MEKVIAKHGYISIPNYTLGDSTYLENILSVYDDVYHTKTPLGFYYEEEDNELRIPLGFGVNEVAKILRRMPDGDFNYDEPNKAVIALTTEPKSVLQRQLISFLAGEGAYRCNAKYAQICIEAGTGSGKTYCMIAAITIIRQTAFVISSSSKLRLYWANSAKKFTNLTDNDICIIDSSSKIDNLLEGKKKPKYKFYSATHDIIESYARNHSWKTITELFKRLGVGVTVIDEVHENFGNTVKILTHINSHKIFHATATLDLSDYKANQIFQSCFSSMPKYIQAKRIGDDSQKHITGLMLIYDSNPSLATELACDGRKGFNMYEYAKYQIESDTHIFNILSANVSHFTINGKMKTMIFCGAIESCETIANYFANKFPDILVGVYHSKVKLKPAEKDKVLEVSDLIITTAASLGTGSDIEGLHCIIDIEASSSEKNSKQRPGRLRDWGDGRPSYFINIVNKGFKKAFKQYKNRKKIYSKNFGKIIIKDYTKRK